MKNISTVIPVSRQVVKITESDNSSDAIGAYGVVDVVTLDGRLKLFCMDDLRSIKIEAGSRVVLEYGQDDALYRSTWKIDYIEFGDTKKDLPSLLLLSPAQQINRIQRRNYFRLTVLFDVRFKTIVVPKDFAKNRNLRNEMYKLWQIERKTFPHFGQIIDISEGGLCFISKTKMKKGDQIILNLILPEQSLLLPSDIMWTSFTERSGDIYQKMGVKFISAGSREKTKIQKFICSEQRKQIKENVVR